MSITENNAVMTYNVPREAVDSRASDEARAREFFAKVRLDAAVAEAESRIERGEPYSDTADREEFRRRYSA